VRSYEALPYNISALKAAVLKYGSAVTAIYADDDDTGLNKSTSAYRVSDASVIPNHMVQIVGWDNEFPASKFTDTPELDGAWIVRDSRGESFGDKGYIYVSYDDSTIAKSLYVITDVSEADDNDKMYSHSKNGASAAVNFNSKTAWSANTFEVDSKAEKLSAVAFYTVNSDVSYEIWINDLGKMNVKKLLKTGKAENAGYVTVDLDYPLVLRNSKFSVLVKMTSENVTHVPVEKRIEGAIDSVEAKLGASFISKDGSNWIDIAEKMVDANLCVRAWTTS
jgi:hypothetical protein